MVLFKNDSISPSRVLQTMVFWYETGLLYTNDFPKQFHNLNGTSGTLGLAEPALPTATQKGQLQRKMSGRSDLGRLSNGKVQHTSTMRTHREAAFVNFHSGLRVGVNEMIVCFIWSGGALGSEICFKSSSSWERLAGYWFRSRTLSARCRPRRSEEGPREATGTWVCPLFSAWSLLSHLPFIYSTLFSDKGDCNSINSTADCKI